MSGKGTEYSANDPSLAPSSEALLTTKFAPATKPAVERLLKGSKKKPTVGRLDDPR